MKESVWSSHILQPENEKAIVLRTALPSHELFEHLEA